MPDNVSLTAQDINTLKSVQTNAQTRLNVKNFSFNSDASIAANTQSMSLIGNNTHGIKIYAGKQDTTIQASDTSAVKATFNFNQSFSNAPVITATISSNNQSIQYKNFTIVVQVDPSNIDKAIVWVKPTDALQSPLDITINVIAISYA